MPAYLIVGASGTIGSEVACSLAGPETALALHYCGSRAAAEQTRGRAERRGARAVCIQSALDTEVACEAAWEQSCAAVGIPDGLALCAGRVPWRPWQELTAADWSAAVFEHSVAPFTIARLAVEAMRMRGRGSIVFLSSIAAKYGGSPKTLHYAAAKAALETSMRGLARDVAQAGVRINGVRSGFVNSPQHGGRTAEQIAQRVRLIPMARPGQGREVAAAVAFLLSDAASFITGETLTVAGGD